MIDYSAEVDLSQGRQVGQHGHEEDSRQIGGHSNMKEMKMGNYEVSDFEQEVIRRSHLIPVVVDFWAEWCAPCRVLGPVLERLADKNKERWILAKVDTERHQDLASQYAVRSIPTVKLFVDGKVANEFTGALPEHMVVQWLDRSLPNKLRKEVERAQGFLDAGKTFEAQAVLNKVLQQDPGNEDARVALAGTYVKASPKKAVEMVEGIEEHSKNFPLVDAIRNFAALMEKLNHPDSLAESEMKPLYLEAIRALADHEYEKALEGFIEVIRADRYYDEDGSRRACIAIFKLLGEEHATTQTYRRSFSSALY
jgi:putative thioredoxin